MRILIIAPALPFPHIKGHLPRAYYFIKGFSKEYRIDLCSFYEDRLELKNLKQLKKYCHKIELVYLPKWLGVLKGVKSFINFIPFQVNFYSSFAMRNKIKALSRRYKYSAIYILTSRMMPYAGILPSQKIILDYVDSLAINFQQRAKLTSNIFKKILFYYESLLMYRYEKKCLLNSGVQIVAAIQDKQILGGSKIMVIPTPVDSNYFKPIPHIIKDIDIIFTGNLSYLPNIDGAVYFCQSVLPIILKSYSNIKVYLVGANPPRSVRRLANKNIIVTGFVEDLRQYLNRAKICIDPVRRGTGIQNKILEAFASGLPVVATSFSNQAIGAKNNKEIILADTPQQFAHSIISLLQSKKKRGFLATNARCLVVRWFKWEDQINKFKRILDGIL